MVRQARPSPGRSVSARILGQLDAEAEPAVTATLLRLDGVETEVEQLLRRAETLVEGPGGAAPVSPGLARHAPELLEGLDATIRPAAIRGHRHCRGRRSGQPPGRRAGLTPTGIGKAARVEHPGGFPASGSGKCGSVRLGGEAAGFGDPGLHVQQAADLAERFPQWRRLGLGEIGDVEAAEQAQPGAHAGAQLGDLREVEGRRLGGSGVED